MKKTEKLKVLIGKKDRGEYVDTVYEGVTVPLTFCKWYDSSLNITAKFNSLSRNLLDYLVSRMAADNVIYNNKLIKQDFIDTMERLGIKYSYKGLDRAFKELEENKALIRISKGLYYVSPVYFWKNAETERKKIIKKVIELRKKDKVE